MPGTAKKRTKSEALPLLTLFTSLTQEMVSLTEKTGSLTPCVMRSLPLCFLKPERSVESARMKSHEALAKAPDSAKILAASVSKLKFSRYSSWPGPDDGVGVGGVVNIAETAPLPSVALMLELPGALNIPSFQARQPGLLMPTSKVQSE